MANKYVHVGPDERVYPDLGVTAQPGSEHTLERLPDDGRWETKAAHDKPEQPAEKGK